MARPPRLHFPGAIFHVISRGNFRQNIFLNAADWEHFLKALGDLKRAQPFKLYAYCLMSNHIHLLIEPGAASISRIMSPLLSGHAQYLNARLGRTGHVFQGRFKAPLCRKDAYLQHLVRYIHMNPVAAGAADEPAAWPYSGHREYLGMAGFGLIDQELILSMFHDDLAKARAAYARFVDSASTVGPATSIPPPQPATLEKELGAPLQEDSKLALLADLAAKCAAAAGVSLESMRSASHVRRVVSAKHDFVRRAFHAGYLLVDIAAYLGLGASAAAKALAKFR